MVRAILKLRAQIELGNLLKLFVQRHLGEDRVNVRKSGWRISLGPGLWQKNEMREGNSSIGLE